MALDNLAQSLCDGHHGVHRFSLYGGDCADVLAWLDDNSFDSLVTDPPAGISFMGKNWDGDKGGRDAWVKWLTGVMRESYRVLKPGAHALVWAIPRTSHWTMTALENAGFEIRDVVTHLFGSGFPKSLDVSKAIDKAAGATREIVGVAGRSGATRSAMAGDFAGGDYMATAPATPDAEKWQGFGTALKPAAEFWVLCRKPLGEKTVAANVLKHGTGALNIDGCRIEGAGSDWAIPSDAKPRESLMAFDGKTSPNSDSMIKNRAGAAGSPLGRFPANLVFSHSEGCGDTCEPDCAVRMLDEQSGTLKSGSLLPGHKRGDGSNVAYGGGGVIEKAYGGDSGGASRFFYVAKASKKDKGTDNTHPTVKSTALMGYLIRMVTPPGGCVLDPFAGSGTTGVAALREGLYFLGVEKEPEYFDTAARRLDEAEWE